MARATTVQAAGAWKGEPADVVVLDSEARARRKATLTGQRGTAIELDLEQAVNVRTGDAFVLEDGRFVEVVGKPEALMEVRPKDDGDLVRIAWQLGNHHLPLQIAGRKLRIRANTEIAAILSGLGAKITPIEAAFDPEGGAYLAPVEADHAHGHGCGCGHHHHDHGHHHHDHDHGHHHAHDGGCCGGHHARGQDHSHDHKHEHKHDHGHAHGEDCGCGHHHSHKHD